MTRRRVSLAFLGAALSLSTALAAQTNRYRFERISLEHGLSQSTIWAIVQDHKGFLWFGTQDGLNMYDGYGFTVFRHEPGNPKSIRASYVRALLVDSEGTLWVGTDGGGLNRLDYATRTFTAYVHDPDDPGSLGNDDVRAIYEDSTGAIWVGTEGGGLSRLQPETGRFDTYRHDPKVPASLGSDNVRAILGGADGTIWVGTNGGGLDLFDPSTDEFRHHRHDPLDPTSISHDVVWTLYRDRDGVLWIGTDGGLSSLEPRTMSFARHAHEDTDEQSLSYDNVRAVFEDSEGVFWVGTRRGLNVFHRARGVFEQEFNRPGDPTSISNSFIRAIFEDRSGVMWFGTDGGGANKYDRLKHQFALYQHRPSDPQSLSANMVYSVFKDQRSVLWVGTWGGGLNRIDPRADAVVQYVDRSDSLLSNVIKAIHENEAGLWLATSDGLRLLDPLTERSRYYRHDPDDGNSLSHDDVTSFAEDSTGALWVGTSGGLDRFADGMFTHYRSRPDDPTSLSDDRVSHVYIDPWGTLWVGTLGGLNRFHGATESFTTWHHDADDDTTLSNDFVRSIIHDRAGRMWVATDGGLNRLDEETGGFRRYGVKDGLPSAVVYGILESNDGDLWMSTNGGLARFDAESDEFEIFDATDGLQGDEFNTGAYHRSADGELFFGGINGLTAFRPESLRVNTVAPSVVFTDFRRFNEPVELDTVITELDRLELSYEDRVISLEVAALDYHSPAQTEYEYFIEELSDDWIPLGDSREITLTNVDPGDYTVRVRASYGDGVWNDAGASLRVAIMPAWWGTWWFKWSAATLFVFLLLTAHELRMRAIHSRNEELERRVTVRTSELEKANKELDAFSYSVSHDLQAPLRALNGYSTILAQEYQGVLDQEGQRLLGEVGDNANNMAVLIQDLLRYSRLGRQAVRKEETDPAGVVEKAWQLLAHERNGRDIELTIGNLPATRCDAGLLIHVYENLLSNALKFTSHREVTRIEVGVRQRGENTIFFVKDNGVGFDPAHASKMFGIFQRLHTADQFEGTGVGLAIARGIVERHGGRIWAEGEPDVGATIYFTL